MATSDYKHDQVELDGNISGNQKCHHDDDDDDDANAVACHLHDLGHGAYKDEICHDADNVQDTRRGCVTHVQQEYEDLPMKDLHIRNIKARAPDHDDVSNTIEMEERRRTVETYYNSHHKILVVGEDDFSFAASLATALGSTSSIIATSPDSRDAVISGHFEAKKNLEILEERGAVILHEMVDIHSMKKHPQLEKKLFDRIVLKLTQSLFNCRQDGSCYIECRQELVRGFYNAIKSILAVNGEIHVTHKKGEADDDCCGLEYKDVVITSSSAEGEVKCDQIGADVAGSVHDDGGYVKYGVEESSVVVVVDDDDDLEDECNYHNSSIHGDHSDSDAWKEEFGVDDLAIKGRDNEEFAHDDDVEKDDGCTSVAREDDEKREVIADNVSRSHEGLNKDLEERIATDQPSVEESDASTRSLGDEIRRIAHYNNRQKMLLVGEGDFSFASCLATAFSIASNLTATSLDSRDTIIRNYLKGKTNLQNLEERGAVVIHQVDVHTMDKHPQLIQHTPFDRIVFNFPHAGGYQAKECQASYIQSHRRVVRGFFKAARHMLADNGEIHVTHKTAHPYYTWNIVGLAHNVGLVLRREAKFNGHLYPGYENKKAYGSNWDATFPVNEASTFMFRKT